MPLFRSVLLRVLLSAVLLLPAARAAAQGSLGRTSLSAFVSVPTITADQVKLKYDPMPFNVTVCVHNTGGASTDTVYARIMLPVGQLKLAGADAGGQTVKRVLPVVLAPGDSGMCTFTLTHPIAMVPKNYTIGIWVTTSNADSVFGSADVRIPEIYPPILSPNCMVPDSLIVDKATGWYRPDPFTVSVSAINIGGLPAFHVGAKVYLPAGVVFADSTDSTTHMYDPSTLPQYTGGPMPTVSWTLRYTKKLRYDQTLIFRFQVAGIGTGNVVLDSVDTYGYVKVRGVRPWLNAHQWFPDSLPRNAVATDVVPNPFQIDFRSWNYSAQTGGISKMTLYLPAGQMYLDSTTPDPTRILNEVLQPGDTLHHIWIVHVVNKPYRRRLVMNAMAWTDEGDPLPCNPEIIIDAVNVTTGVESDQSDQSDRTDRSDQTVHADAGLVHLHQNTPNPFNPTTQIEYVLSAAMDVRLTVSDALGRTVRTLVNAHESAGAHSVMFDAGGLPSGTYVCQLETPHGVRTMKMVLAR